MALAENAVPQSLAPVNLVLSMSPQNDPCSPSYVRALNISRARPASPVTAACQNKHTKRKLMKFRIRKLLKAAQKLWRFRGSSRSFARKSAWESKSGPVVPGDSAITRSAISKRVSLRSRRSAVSRRVAIVPSPNKPRQTDALKHNESAGGNWHSPRLSIMLVSRSQRRRYTIHEYSGLASTTEVTDSNEHSTPPPLAKQNHKAFRLSHPSVTHVIQPPLSPATPATSTTSAFPQSSDTDEKNNWSMTKTEDFCTLSRPLTPVSLPATIDFDGQVNPKKMLNFLFACNRVGASSDDFEKLKNTLDGLRLSENSLPGLRRLSGKGTSAFAHMPETPGEPLHAQTEDNGNTDIEKQRASALATLKGLYPAVAQADANITARTEKHHKTLQPRPLARPQSLTVKRPSTMPGPLPPQPFTPDLNPWGNVTHSQKQGKVGVRNGSTSADSNRSSIPTGFAESKIHKAHYSRVESGVFGDLPNSPSPIRPASQEHSTLGSFPLSALAGSRTSISTCPSMQHHQPPSMGSVGFGHHCIKRKPVPSSRHPCNPNKPLPDIPSKTDPKRYTNGLVPEQIMMNENGYPILTRMSTPVALKPMSMPKQQQAMNFSPQKVRTKTEKKPRQKHCKSEKVTRLRKQQNDLERRLQCVML